MKNIRDYGLNLIEEMIDKKMLYRVISSDGKLVLYNYSKRCIYNKEWNQATLNLRGHIFEVDSGNIIAIAFPKFFNLFEFETEQKQEILKKKIYKVYEKIDGSLGIIYFYDGKWRVNTRGRFDSYQAIKGLELLEDLYELTLILETQYIEEKKKRLEEYTQFIKDVKKETGLNNDDPLFRKEIGLRFKRLKYKNSVFLILDKEEEKFDFYIIRPNKTLNN